MMGFVRRHFKAFVVWVLFNGGHDMLLALSGRFVHIPLAGLVAAVVVISLAATALAWRLDRPHRKEIQYWKQRAASLQGDMVILHTAGRPLYSESGLGCPNGKGSGGLLEH